jgi:uncharacterized protein (TIGR03118 family)
VTPIATPARNVLRASVFAAALALAAPVLAVPNDYDVTTLATDVAGGPLVPDPDVVNPWGVAFNPNGTAWVANNRSGKATLYDGNGVKQSLVVTIPALAGTGQGTPTGVVFNSTPDFKFATAPGATPVPASFIFVSLDGLVSAWAPGLTTAVPVQNAPSVYTGVAIAANGTANRLYAANFLGGKIDVYTNTFTATTVPGGFSDPTIPAGFGPFNITAIQGNLYVAYARIGAPVDPGPGQGFVRVFDADGFPLDKGISRGHLNAPWGMAIAPAGFGRFSHRLLVGNFGDGTINAFDIDNGNFVGHLNEDRRTPVVFDGLWAIVFGNGVRAQQTDALFFAAGIDGETHGVYGRIDANE